MFKGTKRAAVLMVMMAVMAMMALTGCMPPAGAEGGEGNALMSFLPLVLIIAVFYFILIRPQNKKNKQVNEMRSALKRGDWVTTIGGFRGRVVKVTDEMLTIEVGKDKVKMDIMRWGISKIEEGTPERSTTRKKRDEEPEEAGEEPKRKPKKLAPAPKKDSEPEEDPEGEDVDGIDEDDEE
ncbi:MAG: preprotein translocase subunit YajC [Clostridiales bacterium]|nr:preprotein translocase subunit YajC [Clostridiales bacterium]